MAVDDDCRGSPEDEATEAGFLVGKIGRPAGECPYPLAAMGAVLLGGELRAAWLRGWEAGAMYLLVRAEHRSWTAPRVAAPRQVAGRPRGGVSG